MATAANNRAEGASNRAEGGEKPIRNLFDDLSVAQVLAGALAAVTSMLLASQIGIYGSVIGVGVGSVISAVASQVYKKFLSASADKIREVGGHGDASVPEEREATEAVHPSTVGVASLPSSSAAETQCLASSAETALLPTVASADTVVMAPVPQASADGRQPANGAMSSPAAESKLYADADRVRAHAARLRKERAKQRVLMVSVVSALIAVVACAAVITLVTQGEGVGAKPQHFVSAGQNAVVQEDESDGGSPSGSVSESQDENGSAADSSPSSDGGKPSQGSSSSGSSSGGESGSQGSADAGGADQGSAGDSGSSSGSGSSEGSGADGSTDQESGSDSSSGSGSTGSDAGGSSGSSSGSGSSESGSQGSASSGSGIDSGQSSQSKAISMLGGGASPVR